jgi:hypothetical protein
VHQDSTLKGTSVKATAYFIAQRNRKDRIQIDQAWIERTIQSPIACTRQSDGRYRLWGIVPESANRILRVILLEDRETVHNAFFDRRYKP